MMMQDATCVIRGRTVFPPVQSAPPARLASTRSAPDLLGRFSVFFSVPLLRRSAERWSAASAQRSVVV